MSSTRREDREAIKIFRSEMTDPTFNSSSETFIDQQADIIGSCAEQAPLINESVELPSNIGFSPDMADEYDIHIDAIAFTRAVSNYEMEMKFKSSVGSTSQHNARDVYNESPFEVDEDNLDLGLNLYPSGVSATISASASRQKRVYTRTLEQGMAH